MSTPKQFGVPVSSKSQVNIPVTVVSQPPSQEVLEQEQKQTESANVPDDFLDSSIIATPKRMPTLLDLRAKDPNFRARWVNCKADGGRMVDERKAMGFHIAKIEEVVTPDGKDLEKDSILYQSTGMLKYHDVVLMLVPTRLLWGWYKHNALSSAAKVAPRRLHSDALRQGQETLNNGLVGQKTGGRTASEISELISIYDPANER